MKKEKLLILTIAIAISGRLTKVRVIRFCW